MANKQAQKDMYRTGHELCILFVPYFGLVLVNFTHIPQRYFTGLYFMIAMSAVK